MLLGYFNKRKILGTWFVCRFVGLRSYALEATSFSWQCLVNNMVYPSFHFKGRPVRSKSVHVFSLFINQLRRESSVCIQIKKMNTSQLKLWAVSFLVWVFISIFLSNWVYSRFFFCFSFPWRCRWWWWYWW